MLIFNLKPRIDRLLFEFILQFKFFAFTYYKKTDAYDQE